MSVELQIAGMTSAACAQHVEQALTHAGARDVRVDWQLGRATVDPDGVASGWNPYLTLGEGLYLAAQSFHRDPSKLSCCAA